MMKSGLKRCPHGFALVNAIFLLLLMAALAALVASFSASQHAGSAMDVQGSQAYQAARAGIEWGVYRQLVDGSCAATSSFVPAAPTLNSFTVTVRCVATTLNGTTHAGTATSITVFEVTANACNQPDAGECPGTAGGAHYIERQLQVKL